MKIPDSQIESLLLAQTKWVDVRAPIEFQSGSVPGAVNLPLLDDRERHEIGITYKERGQDAAIELGHQLVCGEVKEDRIRAWLAAMQDSTDSVLYCFRGGLRSQTVQHWLFDRGVDRPIIQGGYKSIRRFFLEILETRAQSLNFSVVCGPTGSGKTTFLQECGRPMIDLEALAVHRGSAFGALGPQPSQAQFENELAMRLLPFLVHSPVDPILIEDESRLIGRCSIPEKFFEKIKSSPRVYLEVSLDDRVENIFKDYILLSSLGTHNDRTKFEDFRRSVIAITRKLGGSRAQEILVDINHSESQFAENRSLDSNRVWIRKLLQWYYDPLYKR